MHSDYLISVIILTYNSEKYISDCINSVYESNPNEPYEILIIDNNSKDKTFSLVNKKPNIKFFNLPNSDMGMARNYGLSKAKGKYISFLDCDDYYSKERLKRHINILENNYQKDCVIGLANIYFCDRRETKLKKFTLGRKLALNDYFLGKCYSLCAITYRKSFLDKNKIRFDEYNRGRYGEDWHFQTICKINNQRELLDNNISAIIQIRDDSHTQWNVQRPGKCLQLIRIIEFKLEGQKVGSLALITNTLKYALSRCFAESSEFDYMLRKLLNKLSSKHFLIGTILKILLLLPKTNINFVKSLWTHFLKYSFRD